MKFLFPRFRAALTVLLVLGLAATACGASASVDEASTGAADSVVADPQIDPDPEPTEVPEAAPDPTEVPASIPEPEPTPEPAPTDTPEPARTFWADVLSPGDCYNPSALTGEPGELPDLLPCDEFHEEEIYAVGQLGDGPDAPYPGESEAGARAWSELCDAATIEFAGRPWDEVPFVTAALFPTEEEWNAGDRGIMCSAESDVAGRLKIGTAAAGSLDVDAQVVVRVALTAPEVGEFEDWGVIDRHTLLGETISMTDGSFDLQLRRPAATTEGIMFNASPINADGIATALTTIDFATGELAEIPVPVEGFEYSSTVAYGGTLVFAARESDAASWNLFSIFGEGDAVAIGDSEADEHYPSLSRDGQIVVFHRDGDIWRSNFDGTDQVQLTDTDANEWESEISPDGQSIVFVSDRGGSDDLWLMSIDGEDPTQLTSHPADEIWPTWSSDGSTIFFASDRLSPEGSHSTIMVIQPGDAQPSYFSTFTNVSHPLVLDPGDTSISASTFPTLDERYFGDDSSQDTRELIAGDPGTLSLWEHSSGLISAELPAGWSVIENGPTSFDFGPDLDAYYETWAVDGATISVHDAADTDSFIRDVFDGALAANVSECEREEGAGGSAEEGEWLQIAARFACGEESVASVLGVFNTTVGRGYLIEAQSDNVPAVETDQLLMEAIALSIIIADPA